MDSKTLPQLIISAIIILGFGGVIVSWLIWPPTHESTVFGTLIGSLGSGYLIVLNFWFNTSKKDQT